MKYPTSTTTEKSSQGDGWRAIEFFAGIGGFATAWPSCEVQVALDINRNAARVYEQNHPHPYLIAELESIQLVDLQRYRANLWWMSPPCQPYSRRGKGLDLADPRSRAFRHLVELIEKCSPQAVALENVVGFEGSQSYQHLMQALNRCNYQTQSIQICPTELGWPNRRPRFYLLASHGQLHEWSPIVQQATSLTELGLPIAEDQLTTELWLDEDHTRSLFSGLDRVDADEAGAITACFAGSYGRTIVKSGSYLKCGDQLRRFAPVEVAKLLGFPTNFNLSAVTLRQAWKLLGNSLSIPAVRYVLSHLGPPPQ